MVFKRNEPMRTCDQPGCGRLHRAHDKCMGHLKQLERGQPLRPLKPRRTHEVTCGHDTEPHYALGMCRRCYNQSRETGRST